MRLPWKSEHFVTTNGLGAEGMFAVGKIVEQDGECWRVVKHKDAYDGWGGIKVYGRRVKGLCDDAPRLVKS